MSAIIISLLFLVPELFFVSANKHSQAERQANISWQLHNTSLPIMTEYVNRSLAHDYHIFSCLSCRILIDMPNLLKYISIRAEHK
jgi:hypothetical protein